MKITQTANLDDLAERMGNQYTAADAKLFLAALLSMGLEGTDTADVSNDDWLMAFEVAGLNP